jgi:Protein of unknown function (DUF3667)
MGDFEAVGEAVTGGLLARAVEPKAGEATRDGHTQEKNCLNCGAALIGPYCATCGQKAHVHRSVRGFMQDFLQGLFNFEGKFWHTLPMLVWRPGEMTRRYIAGERARFISPIALYLFTVFAMFAVLNFTGTWSPTSTKTKVQGALTASIKEEQASLLRLERKRTAALAGDQELASLGRKIAKDKKDIADAQVALKAGQAFVAGDVDDQTPGWIRPFIENARDNPDMVSLKVQEAASKYSWLLIPLSIPFMWLLFPFRRRYNTYDHAVFVTYSLSFMMLLVIAWSILTAMGFSTLGSLLFFVPPFHMYRHLRGSYELGKRSAILRTSALVGFAFAAAGIFMVTAVAIGAS